MFVVFAGKDETPDAIASRTVYSVRRSAVRAAMVWLKQNNEQYVGIEIDEECLSSLPVGHDGEQLPHVSATDGSGRQTGDLLASGEGNAGERGVSLPAEMQQPGADDNEANLADSFVVEALSADERERLQLDKDLMLGLDFESHAAEDRRAEEARVSVEYRAFFGSGARE
mgnify:CR=1 FL=1